VGLGNVEDIVFGWRLQTGRMHAKQTLTSTPQRRFPKSPTMNMRSMRVYQQKHDKCGRPALTDNQMGSSPFPMIGIFLISF